ncbi:hypothetical protein DRO35_05550 [Candidatus Bathyarchaeota archaeon]|nr:MAG: hypothetical protein DRO35_05550 [Candidatus Bathyarchaeota archaeon]
MLFLGVDGGATKTVAAVADEQGSLLGLGYSGSTCYHFVGVEEAKRNLESAVKKAMKEAKVGWNDLDAICYGLSSVDDTPMDTEVIRRFASEVTHKPFILVNDVVNAYYATCRGKPGVTVVAGTGSIAYGMNAKGERVRVGGWGQILGDEGSAVYIGRRAFQEASKAYDGRRRYTLLADLLPRAMGLTSLYDISFNIMSGRMLISELGRLAPAVSEAAHMGDKAAIRILREAGRELALLAVAGLKRLGLRSEATVGASGSAFRSGKWLWETFTSEIRRRNFRIHIDGPIYGGQPVVGAIFLAAHEAGVKMKERDVLEILEIVRKREEAIA